MPKAEMCQFDFKLYSCVFSFQVDFSITSDGSGNFAINYQRF